MNQDHQSVIDATKAAQPVSMEVTLNGVRTRSDGTLSLSIQTSREFTAQESVAVMQLNRMVLDMILRPLKSEETPFEIKGSDEHLSHSQRIRNALYCLFKFEQEKKTIPADELFEIYYAKKCERILDWIKRKLPEL